MDHKLKKDRFALCETVCDAESELPIECDLLLPDYCPDIVKLLRCRVKPYLTKSQIMGEKCILEAAVQIELFYAGTDGKIHVSEHRAQLSKTLEMKGQAQRPLVFCSLRQEYLNCKAVSQRRVDLRGAFSASVKVLSCREEEMITSAEGAGLQLLRQPVGCCEFTGEILRKFTVREELPLPAELPEMESLLRHDEQVRLTDWRIAGGKLLVKGEVQADLVYLSDEGSVERASFLIPVSQMADLDAVLEPGSSRVVLQMAGAAYHPGGENGASSLWTGEFSLMLRCLGSRDSTLLPAVDAYSTRYEVQKEERHGLLVQQVAGLPASVTAQSRVDLPEGFSDLWDCWCDPGALSVSFTAGELCLCGKLRWCVLGRDGDGVPACVEKEESVTLTVPLSGITEDTFGLWQITVSPGPQGTAQEGLLSCSAQITVDGSLYRPVPVRYLSGIRVDESREKKTRENAAMTIYYAEAGENLWSIAKEYGTSMDAVMEENELESAQLKEKQVILIPMIG
ncbi:MAG: DUF3794 domain-containing protein [Oscillospiraceae bacterium]|nr:DUF3794 domain-containing protein [Oscillospiraceae bacterium]